jgi:hypothetical protein
MLVSTRIAENPAWNSKAGTEVIPGREVPGKELVDKAGMKVRSWHGSNSMPRSSSTPRIFSACKPKAGI